MPDQFKSTHSVGLDVDLEKGVLHKPLQTLYTVIQIGEPPRPPVYNNRVVNSRFLSSQVYSSYSRYTWFLCIEKVNTL